MVQNSRKIFVIYVLKGAVGVPSRSKHTIRKLKLSSSYNVLVSVPAILTSVKKTLSQKTVYKKRWCWVSQANHIISLQAEPVGFGIFPLLISLFLRNFWLRNNSQLCNSKLDLTAKFLFDILKCKVGQTTSNTKFSSRVVFVTFQS